MKKNCSNILLLLLYTLSTCDIYAFDNSCLLKNNNLQPPTTNAPKTFLKDCAAWVVNTTDMVWNDNGKYNVNETLEQYFHPEFTSYGSFGTKRVGMEQLKNAVATTKLSFPDLEIHITDAFCIGNDIDGYKTIMPDVLTGTNLGDSQYGPATGKKVTYSGIAVTYVQKNPVTNEWQYIAEWILHDEFSIISQLGIKNLPPHPNTTSSPNIDCTVDQPTWGWHSFSHDTKKENNKKFDSHLPLSKSIIKQMDSIISNHIDCFDWPSWSKAMQPFWTENMIYDTNWVDKKNVLGNSTGLHAWFNHEHVPWNIAFPNATFNQLIFAGEDSTATTTTYANAFWAKDLAGIPSTGNLATIHIFDFYRIDVNEKRISYNWMLLDLVDLMHQSLHKTGKRVLPKPKLLSEEGWMQAPRAMDGIPAPMSALNMLNPTVRTMAKSIVQNIINTQFINSNNTCNSYFTNDMIWYGPAAFGVANNCEEYYNGFLMELYTAFPNRVVNIDVLTCEYLYCGVHGTIISKQEGIFLGTAATNKVVNLRFGFHYHIDEDTKKVKDAYALFDLPKAFNDMGIDLFERMRVGGLDFKEVVQ